MMTHNTKAILRVTAYLRKIDPDMTLSQLQILLLLDGKRDVLVRDLVKSTGLYQSTVARRLSQMGDEPMRGQKEGLGLVDQKPDPEDPRRMFVNLTDKGRRVLADLSTML